MKRDEHYMDQLFEDHFKDFAKSPSDEVWEGIVTNGNMANGKPFGLPGGWKSGVTLLSCVLFCLLFLSGSDPALVAEVPTVKQFAAMADEVNWKNSNGVSGMEEEDEGNFIPPVDAKIYEPSNTKGFQPSVAQDTEEVEQSTAFVQNRVEVKSTPEKPVLKNLLAITQVPGRKSLADSAETELDQRAKRLLKNGLFANTYYKKPKVGHWFVSGGFVLDSGYGYGNGYADGFSFGAGKYINQNSFLEVALRGIWDYGFNLRATYTQLLLKGKIRPFLQAGLAWDTELDLRAGAGILYEPSPLNKWRIYASVNYEKSSRLLDQATGIEPVFEFGVQLRLSGTEPLLSDNNWMNSVPHYKVPAGWYLEGSSNFAFFDKTKVTRVSSYVGKNLNRRLYMRGGVRFGEDRTTVPVQLQFHAVVRQKLRFGAYAGTSLNVSQLGVGAELGLIAYYEVIPGWSLYVAPVILDNSQYEDRIFETGIRYYLGKKK